MMQTLQNDPAPGPVFLMSFQGIIVTIKHVRDLLSYRSQHKWYLATSPGIKGLDVQRTTVGSKGLEDS